MCSRPVVRARPGLRRDRSPSEPVFLHPLSLPRCCETTRSVEDEGAPPGDLDCEQRCESIDLRALLLHTRQTRQSSGHYRRFRCREVHIRIRDGNGPCWFRPDLYRGTLSEDTCRDTSCRNALECC